MEIKFIPIEYDYFDWQGRNYARIIGRDDNGKRVLVIDSFEPFLYAILKPNLTEKQIEKLKEKIEKIEIKSSSRTTKIEKIKVEEKNFLSKRVKALKIYITNYKDAHQVADKLDLPEIQARRGYDLSFHTKYIIERALVPLSWYKIDGEILNNSEEFGGIDSAYDVDICIKAENIEKIEKNIDFKPKIIAFDIETEEFDIGKGEILMISLAGENFKKVLTWKKCSESPDFVECFKDEEEMLEAFIENVKKLEPDILVGYFSDGFDLPYLRARAEKHKIKLNIGLDNSQPVFARGRVPKGSVSGIVHIDIFRFIETVYSQYLQSETLGLNEVATELLGEGKKEFEFKHSSKIKQHEWPEFFQYNLQDSILTYKLAEKFWPDMQEFCKILQEPLFEITRDSMSQHVENYLIHNLEKYNEIVEKRPIHDEIGERMAREKYEGAFVFQPKPGLHENLAMFDFTSMYGSVIVTYNLSKATLTEDKKDSYEVQLQKQKAHFSKKPGFFPLMLKEIIEKRKQLKQKYKTDPSPINKARSNAYKLLANASYGYLGFFGARYYCVEAAAAAAALSRKSIHETIDMINKEGYEVIYSDTDSIAFLMKNNSKKQTLEFLKSINSKLPGIM
ncbi:MAG: DNA-directed DNA polymerase [Nanoarchaeota archaeon]|nr:DNA-directed DNA polymerase [Nanoarchaeota archaeon]